MKNKLERFADLFNLPNVYQNPSVTEPRLLGLGGEEADMKGAWREKHFKNNNPIVLELACGKGEYTLNLGKDFPEQNFIGVDLKGNRLWKGASDAVQMGLNNVAFIRTQIEHLDLFFAEGEVDEIWITFPDPFLRPSKAKKRLTSTRFLEIYRKFLKPDGIVQLKTDDPTLYDFTLETLAEEKLEILYQNNDIYASELAFPVLAYKTTYEKMHLINQRTIKYVRFKL